MSAHLPILIAYLLVMVGLGLYISRRVSSADSFFVAGRGLGPGLLFATLLASNIGAGSTVGAAALGYTNGIAAWWWVGAAAAGSFIQAFWIGPRMRREAERHGLRTVGDYLELRFGGTVRTVVSILLWLGTLAILAAQLIAMSTLLTAMVGLPRWFGCVLGGIAITLYFTAGGLHSSARVNVLQLVVKMVGFAVAVPFALAASGGWDAFASAVPADQGHWNFMRNGDSGWMYLALLGPAFIVSPGQLQKIYAARDERAVRIGVGFNALGLLLFAAMPPLLGMMARVRHPDISADQALPVLLVQDVPVAIGTLGLAAIFSAELSAADAILFMLSTSLSQDLYRRVMKPDATDAEVLRVARIAAVAGGAGGIAVALLATTIIGSLQFFYSVMAVCLFVPLLGGLYVRRLTKSAALAAIVAGIVVMLLRQFTGPPKAVITPAMAGLGASIIAAAIALLVLRKTRDV